MSEFEDTVSADTKIDITETLKEGWAIGIKNLLPILVNVILWAVTIWIPYLNVGTTIGLVGLVLMASKGETISYTEIFNPQYRKYMGEFFLTCGFMVMGVIVGIIFGIIPGIVIGIAWSLALFLVIDKGKNPSEALALSNNLTYGYKWRIFFVTIIWAIIVSVAEAIVGLIPAIDKILTIAIQIFNAVISMGISASIYKQLTREE